MPNEKFGDPTDPSGYFVCKQGIPVKELCPQWMIWNLEEKRCTSNLCKLYNCCSYLSLDVPRLYVSAHGCSYHYMCTSVWSQMQQSVWLCYSISIYFLINSSNSGQWATLNKIKWKFWPVLFSGFQCSRYLKLIMHQSFPSINILLSPLLIQILHPQAYMMVKCLWVALKKGGRGGNVGASNKLVLYILVNI